MTNEIKMYERKHFCSSSLTAKEGHTIWFLLTGFNKLSGGKQRQRQHPVSVTSRESHLWPSDLFNFPSWSACGWSGDDGWRSGDLCDAGADGIYSTLWAGPTKQSHHDHQMCVRAHSAANAHQAGSLATQFRKKFCRLAKAAANNIFDCLLLVHKDILANKCTYL